MVVDTERRTRDKKKELLRQLFSMSTWMSHFRCIADSFCLSSFLTSHVHFAIDGGACNPPGATLHSWPRQLHGKRRQSAHAGRRQQWQHCGQPGQDSPPSPFHELPLPHRLLLASLHLFLPVPGPGRPPGMCKGHDGKAKDGAKRLEVLLFKTVRPREFPFRPSHPPLLFYTDASDVPERTLITLYRGSLDSKATYMNQLEALAALLP